MTFKLVALCFNYSAACLFNMTLKQHEFVSFFGARIISGERYWFFRDKYVVRGIKKLCPQWCMVKYITNSWRELLKGNM
jgi:hypothetical protein